MAAKILAWTNSSHLAVLVSLFTIALTGRSAGLVYPPTKALC